MKKMVEYDTDFHGNILTKEEEIYFIYEGPTFNNKMEIPSLLTQLKSTEKIIQEIIKEVYSKKKLDKPNKVKIYIKLKKGSFQEIISVILNHPLTGSIIGGLIVDIINRLLSKKSNVNNTTNINVFVKNYYMIKEISNLSYPLQNKNDKLIIRSPSKKEIETIITFNEKKIFKNILKTFEKEFTQEIYEEEFFGYLSVLYIDKEKYKFTLEGTKRPIPAEFEKKPSIEEIKKILGEKIKIKAKAIYKNNELEKIIIKEYEIKKRENLKEFFEAK